MYGFSSGTFLAAMVMGTVHNVQRCELHKLEDFAKVASGCE